MRVALRLIVGLLAVVAAQPAFAGGPPTLIVEAPPELASAQRRLESFDRQSLGAVVGLVGLDDPGPTIRVTLAGPESEWSAGVAPWTAGYAIGAAGRIVLFPSRSPAYPHDTLEDVFRHEVAHILISRAAGHRPVARWFHEGLAVTVERRWGLEDRTRLTAALMVGRRLTLDGIDDLFSGDRGMQTRAYSLAAAVVRDLVAEYGTGAPAAILRRVAEGTSFDAALASITGRTRAAYEAGFWNRQRTWSMWMPLLASGSVMWLGVVALAGFALRRRRRRAMEIRKSWAAEDAAARHLDSATPTERSDDGERAE